MRRFHFFADQELIDRLNRDKKQHGFTSLGAFIRYILIKFFEKK